MSKKKHYKPSQNRVSRREHRHVIVLNEMENKALNNYLKKYKIQNKSKFIRETLMVEVIKRMEKDQPTLFDNLVDKK